MDATNLTPASPPNDPPADADRPVVHVDEALTTETVGWLDEMKALVVENEQDYTKAIERLALVKAFIAKYKALFQPHIDRLNEAKNALSADLKAFLDPLVAAEQQGKDVCVAWVRLADAERARVEAERREQARKDEETRRVNTAAALESEAHRTGNIQMADAATRLINAPVPTPAIMPVLSRVPKVTGSHTTRKWKGRLTSKIELIKFVAANPDYVHLLDENQGNIDRTCNTFKERTKIGGVEAYEDIGLSIQHGKVLGR